LTLRTNLVIAQSTVRAQYQLFAYTKICKEWSVEDHMFAKRLQKPSNQTRNSCLGWRLHWM